MKRWIWAVAIAALGCVPAGGGSGGGDGAPLDAGVFDALPPPPSDGGARADAALDAQVVDATAPDQAVPVDPPIGVATYNVQRFFDLNCDSSQCGEGDFEFVPTGQWFNRRAEDLARAIIRLHRQYGADVVALQEIESQDSLDKLQFYLQQLDSPFNVQVLGELGYPASLDVALLARGELVRVYTHQDTEITRPDGSSTRFSRELLEVHLDVTPRDDPQGPARRLIVFVAHFKSQNNDDQGRRRAEARATRDIMIDVAARHPQAMVLLAGDLNDEPGSPTLNDLELEGALQRVAADIGAAAATYRYFGQESALDHIYRVVSSAGRYVPRSAVVVRSDGQDGFAGSDHAALSAHFDFPTE